VFADVMALPRSLAAAASAAVVAAPLRLTA
jgi:hypothetical protein